MARLLEQYREKVVPQLKEELGKANLHAVPRVEKIIVSMGVGEGARDSKILDQCVESLTVITGQKAQRTRARKSIAAFKLREGTEVGCRVTLRRKRMYEFLDRLITLALPRVRDFRGLNSKAFDGSGNYSFGLTEQLVFPEIDPDKIPHVQGMNITIVTSAQNNEEGRALLRSLGLPLRTDDEKTKK
ncbi:50S ribosomal protein L5 [Stratiformator vulcanicus]|uniref:Large ribosomal subunit protein uL5 n=1 Tax=Stratiformator vulcanicus TaxID=2527980 RepID=A0A517R0T0_9PLAN|nr:50S ribosomal protein L5 [Stratiformator vulcanicus]QDT37512.1 50S ribosomal protein L5 [Stratiformator vulcanicus]